MNLFGFNAQKHFNAIAGLAAVSGESLESVIYNLNFFTQSGFARGLARMGVNVKELQKATQGLRAGTDEFREATIKFIGSQEKFKNAVSVQRNTLAGLRDDIHDVFEAFKLDILGLNSENGLMGGYKRFLRQIRNFLVEHKEGLRQIAEAIGKVLGGVFDILGGAFTRMTKKFGEWIDSTGNFLRGNQDLITQFVFWLGLIELRVESIFATALTWTNKFVEALGGWQTVLTGLAAGGIVGTILSIANAVKTFGGALGLTNPYIWAGVAAITSWTMAYKELQSLGLSLSDMTGKDWLGTGKELLTGGAFRGTPASKTIHTSAADSAAATDKIRSIDSSVNKGATYNVVFPNVRTAEQAKNTLDTLSARRAGEQRNPRARGAQQDPRLDPEYIIHHKWQ